MKFKGIGVVFLVCILGFSSLLFSISIAPPIIDRVEASSDPITTRYDCHKETDYHNGTYSQTIGLPCWVRGSPFTKFILTSYEDRIEMQNGLVGSQLNKTDAKMYYYDRYFHDLKSIESWKVEYYNNGWINTNIDSATTSFSTLQNDTGVYVTSTKQNTDVRLEIQYIVLEGIAMKHRIEIKNLGAEREFRIIQEHHVIEADNVRYSGSTIGISSSFTLTNNRIDFQHSNGTSILFEEQKNDYYRNVTINPTGNNVDAKFMFGNSGNRTSLNLATNSVFGMESGATCTANDCSKQAQGQWLVGAGSEGANVESIGGSTQSNSKGSVGKEDGNRALWFFATFRTGNISNSATISAVKMNFGTIGGKDGSYSCSSNCGVNLDIHVVNTDSCQEHDQTLGNNIFKAPVVVSDEDPDDWENDSSPNFNARGVSYFQNMLTNGTDTDLPCIGMTQTGTDVSGGSSAHEFWTIGSSDLSGGFMTITVTYSTTTYYDTQINLMMYDDSTNVTIGDPQIRFASRNNTFTTWKDCTKTIGSGTVGVCHVLTNSGDDTQTRIWIRWAGNGETCSSDPTDCKGLKIEGQDSYNFTSTSGSRMLKLQVSIYKNTTLHFHDNDGTRNTPQNFTMKSGHNASDKTVTFADESAKGAITIGYTTNGTSGSENRGGSPASDSSVCVTLKSCNRMTKIYELGNARNANQTAYFNVTADNQIVSFRQKVYLVNFDYRSHDRLLADLSGKVDSTSFSINNGTVGDVFRPSASQSNKMQIGNDSLTMEAIRVYGVNVLNSSIGAISIGDDTTLDYEWKLTLYPVTWKFMDVAHSLTTAGITPTNFQYTAPNSTEVTQTDFSKSFYFTNGSITPKGVTYQGQGMIQNDTAITINEAETNLINLQFYKVSIQGRTLGSTISDLDDNWNVIITFANGTETDTETGSDGSISLFMGNGSNSITGQWNGLNVNNSFSYTSSATETLLMYLKVYEDTGSATRVAVNGTSLSDIEFGDGPDLSKVLNFKATASTDQAMRIEVRSSAYGEPSETQLDDESYYSGNDWSWDSATKIFGFTISFSGSEVDIKSIFQAGSAPPSNGNQAGGGGGGNPSGPNCAIGEVYRGGRCQSLMDLEVDPVITPIAPQSPVFEFGVVAIGAVIIGVLAVGERQVNGNRSMGSLWKGTRKKKPIANWKKIDKLWK